MYDLEHKKYFSEVRVELLELIPTKNRAGRMLEIGAAGGDTLIYAKNNGYAGEVYGVELFQINNSNQTNSILDGFKIESIEDYSLDYEEKSFDVVLIADVLEHLYDPLKVLSYVKKFLKDDGVMLISLPNFRYYEVLIKIFIKGDFKYEDAGILDRTHIRFFCKKNIIELLKSADFNIITLSSAFDKQVNSKKYILNKLFLNKLRDFFVFQYFIVATKND